MVGTTPRAERVAEQIRSALAQAVREKLRDPRIGFVTLTEIKLSPDLRHATIFVTVIDEAVRDDRQDEPLDDDAPADEND